MNIFDVESGTSIPVTDCVSAFGDAAWSVDSSHLVFGCGAPGDIRMVNRDGSGIQTLVGGPMPEFGPGLSPDGRSVAFRRSGEGDGVISVNLDTGEELRLFGPGTGSGSDQDTAVWSPDGARVAFFGDAPDGPGIYVVNRDGTGLYRLVAAVPYVTGIYWLSSERLGFVVEIGGL
jgi:Tol biopolymer transport system component